MQRIELIARIFAEIAMKPMFCGILKLLSEGGMEKMAFRLRDQFVEYDPNEWRDQYDMTVNVGLGSGDANQKIQALQMIAANQMALLPMGLADPEKIYHTQTKIVEAAGFKDVQNFIIDPKGKPPVQPPPNPMLQVEQMKQQGAAQANQFKAQQEMQTLQITTQLQDQQHQREMQRDMEVERNKQEMQARDSQFQAQLEAQKEAQRMQMEEASKEADRMLKKYIADLDAQVKLTIAGIKSPEVIEGEEAEKVEKEDKFLMAMQAMMQQMTAPKVVVRDANGRAVGIQHAGVNNGT
jgi:hypothetical protein